MPSVASQRGMWTLQSRSTSVKTLSEPVPVTGQVVQKASPISTTPGMRTPLLTMRSAGRTLTSPVTA